MKEKPVVYFAKVQDDDKERSIEKKICKLFDRAGFPGFVNEGELVAVKTHFGEMGNQTHIRANHIRQIVDKIKERGGKPYLTETSVLYKSRRSNALDHILLAFEHGFTYEKVGAPIIMADGFLGNWDREIASLPISSLLSRMRPVISSQGTVPPSRTWEWGSPAERGSSISTRRWLPR
jgi:uncharacterized Fe-S center protein